jgi:hypothetical protein
MNPDQAAGKYIVALQNSHPKPDHLDFKVSGKGEPSTRLIKQIVLNRLDGAGCKPQFFKGDTYTCSLENEIARFNFRVTATARAREWWTNFSEEELIKLRDDYEAVILAVWHRPAEWLKRLMVFAIPPSAANHN